MLRSVLEPSKSLKTISPVEDGISRVKRRLSASDFFKLYFLRTQLAFLRSSS